MQMRTNHLTLMKALVVFLQMLGMVRLCPHRGGTAAQPASGNLFKGPFPIPPNEAQMLYALPGCLEDTLAILSGKLPELKKILIIFANVTGPLTPCSSSRRIGLGEMNVRQCRP